MSVVSITSAGRNTGRNSAGSAVSIATARSASEPRVAVLLNANARQVNGHVLRALSHVVGRGDLMLSRSPLETRSVARKVLDGGYDTVFCGGGDGTFIAFVNAILAERETRFPAHPLPRFGVLRLGTGNGLASWVSASTPRGDGFLDDVLRARANQVPSERTLHLLDVEGQRAPFAGVGIDGQVLNDYVWIREHLGKGALSRVLSGGRGYFSAVALRTLPHYLTHATLRECEVWNTGDAPAFRLDDKGHTTDVIEPGGVLFRGRTLLASAATIPYFGYAMRMFPFADQRPAHFQLRLASVGVTDVLPNLGRLWKGEWFPKDKVQDFHARNVRVVFDEPMPLQIGGDAEGYRSHVTFGVSKDTLQLLDFRGNSPRATGRPSVAR
ncbi:MAG: diacylglycerol/lipid kinase family protein [Myxococcaceae bacterium]